MTTLLGAFNKLLINFIDDLITIFPEEIKFKVFKNAISSLKKINPRKVHSIFVEYIEIYRNPLISRDENFFLNNDYKTIIDNSNTSETDMNQLINKLKSHWRNSELTDTNKENIWKYLENLIKLSDMELKRLKNNA